MQRFFFLLFPVLLALVFMPSRSYACGNGCGKKEARSEQAAQQTDNKKSCCAKGDADQGCCEKSNKEQGDSHDCGGKCGGHCGCPTAHAGAVIIPGAEFCLALPEPVHTGHFYVSPFLSNVSLDIWLPPDNYRV